MEFITDRKDRYVQYLYLGGDELHFIASDHALGDEEIDSITENLLELEFPKGPGDYMYKINYEPPQRGEYGVVEIAEYFDLEEVLFRPIRLDQNE